MSLTVQPLTDQPGFGALVTGLGVEGLDDPDTRRSLHGLWIDRGLILFRGLPDDSETQIALSEVFGEPDIHPLKAAITDGEVPRLADLYYEPDRGDIVCLEDGSRLGAWLPWHFDLAYVDRINRGGILRAVELPSQGGATGFLDGIAAYERMPEDLRAEIDGLCAVYRYDGDLAGLRYGATPGLTLERINERSQAVMDKLDHFPAVAHPLVYTQPETGRSVLNFSPWFARGIENVDQDRADELLARVVEVMIDERFAYFHDWESGDLLLWDNWRVLHCARGIPADQRRHMQRTTITGDYGLGRRTDDPRHAVRS